MLDFPPLLGSKLVQNPNRQNRGNRIDALEARSWCVYVISSRGCRFLHCDRTISLVVAEIILQTRLTRCRLSAPADRSDRLRLIFCLSSHRSSQKATGSLNRATRHVSNLVLPCDRFHSYVATTTYSTNSTSWTTHCLVALALG